MVNILTLLDKIPIHESLMGKFLTFVRVSRKNVYVYGLQILQSRITLQHIKYI